jgi:hypothetical protein
LPEKLQWRKQLRGQAMYRSNRAIGCFWDLREGGAVAIPELMRMVNMTNADGVSTAALHALACTGQAGLPYLLSMIEDTNRPGRAKAADWIGTFADHYGSNGIVAVPTLTRHLDDKDPNVADESATALARLYVAPNFVLPQLIDGLASTNANTRRFCAGGLRLMGESRAKPSVPMLMSLRDDPDPEVRAIVIDALRQIAPEVLTDGVSGNGVGGDGK